MSGGSMDYLCFKIEEYMDKLEDPELIELARDFAKLCKDCEWYQSSDICRGEYQESIDAFKAKWFDGSRDERLKAYADGLKADVLRIVGVYDKCGDCEYASRSEYEKYRKCAYKHSCLMHRSESCEKFKRKAEE